MMRFGLREFVFVVLLVAMPIASFLFVFEPRSQHIKLAQKEIKRKQTKLYQLEAATKNFNNLSNEIEKLSKAIEIFEEKLPAQKEVEVILREVWELADKNHLVPKSIRTEKIKTTSHYAEIPIKMIILGNFDGFYQFLIEVEKLPRITRLPEMKLQKIEDGQKQMKADIVLSIFFENDSSNIMKM